MLPSFDDYLHAKEKQKPTTTKKQKQKNKKTKKNTKTNITWFFPQILMIKEPCNLIGSKAQTTSHTQPKEGLSHATFTWWLSPSTKNQWEWAILPRDIDDQRIIQSDWTRDTTDHTHPK